MESSYIEQLTEISSQLPISVLLDIKSRIADWLASGGSESDEYIKQQLVYAKNVLKRQKG